MEQEFICEALPCGACGRCCCRRAAVACANFATGGCMPRWLLHSKRQRAGSSLGARFFCIIHGYVQQHERAAA